MHPDREVHPGALDSLRIVENYDSVVAAGKSRDHSAGPVRAPAVHNDNLHRKTIRLGEEAGENRSDMLLLVQAGNHCEDRARRRFRCGSARDHVMV
jgi:hypothetical protein